MLGRHITSPGLGNAIAQETISPELTVTGLSVASVEESGLRRDSVVVIIFIKSLRDGGRPASCGPSLPRRAAGLCPNGSVRLALRDHLAEGDLRRIRKRALQLLVAHPTGREASRLVGMRRRIEEANRGHDAVAGLDQEVAVEPGQLAQLRDQRLVDLLRQLVGATGVDTLVASHGGMHVQLLTSSIKVE